MREYYVNNRDMCVVLSKAAAVATLIPSACAGAGAIGTSCASCPSTVVWAFGGPSIGLAVLATASVVNGEVAYYISRVTMDENSPLVVSPQPPESAELAEPKPSCFTRFVGFFKKCRGSDSEVSVLPQSDVELLQHSKTMS